jgi:lipopolysaccharide export system protein LptA
MPLLRFLSFWVLLALPALSLYAQTQPGATRPATPARRPATPAAPRTSATAIQPGTPVKGTPVQLLPGTRELQGGVFNGVKIRKLLGNVSFRQDDVFLYCDSAYQYLDRNEIEAFSNVRIVQSDTVTITGDRGFYDGDRRTARMLGNVVMRDPRMTLTTTALDYNLTNQTAYYTVGGHLTDPQNTLDSQQGYYDTRSKVFRFRQDIHLVSTDAKGSQTDLRTDTLTFNTISKIAYLNGPTRIKDAQGANLYAEKGTYNTVTRKSNFERNTKLETPNYLLGGDRLMYDESRQYGEATGHASLLSKKDNILLRGDVGRYWRALGRTKLYGSRPVVRNISGKDTLYLAADTLLSVEARPTKMSQRPILYAWPKVQIFRGAMQGRCDSLTYDRQDSIIYLNRDPVLWQAHNQLVSDSMEIRQKRGQIDQVRLFSKAFVINEDTLHNFNQVKGRNILAYFKQNRINRIDVLGNAESIFYALDGDTVMTGVNKSLSGTIRVSFKENKINKISLLAKPEAAFIPPHELNEDNTRLQGYNWRPTERPTRRTVFGKHFASDIKAKPKAKPKPKGKTQKNKAKVTPRKRPAAVPKKPGLPTAPAKTPAAATKR